ncbi:MAG TPA: hypothetical protein VHG09_00440 [Longimicrobiales bacterium]|nr:hypothetical protein [Longimicrobiales bacterium]
MNRRGALGARLLLTGLLLLSSTGCARLFGSYDLAPNGLASSEARIRHMLASGQAELSLAGRGSANNLPDDEVLRVLYEGVIAYYAGDYEESAHLLDIAGTLADDRITKSVSRSALSLVSNDRILPYEPGRTERLMIPYYAALARLRMGDVEGAAVEARRLSMLLQLYGDDAEPLDPRLEATLRYVTGAIFEAHGDWNDSRVAYRNAVALDSALAIPVDRSVDSTGSVVVILEQGFVAHRVEQGLSVMLLPQEVDLIANGESDERASALGFVAARTLAEASRQPFGFDDSYRDYRPATLFVPPPSDPSLVPRRRAKVVCRTVEESSNATDGNGSAGRKEVCKEEEPEIDELPYLLKVAWPVYRSDSRPATDARLIGTADTTTFVGLANVSRGVVSDFQAERALVVARTVARGAAKLAIAKGAEKKIEEKNETAGAIIGLLGNIGSVLLERADTRSWHLLPAGISIARVQLPPGEHQLQASVGARTVDIDRVRVRAGSVSIVSARVW